MPVRAAICFQLEPGASRGISAALPVKLSTSTAVKPVHSRHRPLSFTGAGQVRVTISGFSAESARAAPSSPLSHVSH